MLYSTQGKTLFALVAEQGGVGDYLPIATAVALLRRLLQLKLVKQSLRPPRHAAVIVYRHLHVNVNKQSFQINLI